MKIYQEKFKTIYESLKLHNIDMWLVIGHETASKSEPILPVLGDLEFIGYTAIVFEKNETATVLVGNNDVLDFKKTMAFDQVLGYETALEQILVPFLKQSNPNTLALNFSETDPSADGLTYGGYLYIKQMLQDADVTPSIVSAQPIVSKVRGIKSEWEVEKIQTAGLVALEIFEAGKSYIKPGVTGIDIFNFFNEEINQRNVEPAWSKTFCPCVFVGPNDSSGHTAASDTVVQKGDTVRIDFGVKVNGFCCDLQRMYYVLKDDELEAPLNVKRAFESVKEAITRAGKQLVPGVTGNEVDTIAREYIQSQNYPSWNAALGHQVGREAHDGGTILGPVFPRYNRKELIHTPLDEGNVFTIELEAPSEAGSVGLEENVVITKHGARYLVPPQQDLYLIKSQ